MANYDEKILKLQEQIEKAEEESLKLKKVTYITNCIIVVDSEKYNLHVLDEDSLIRLLVKLNNYKLSAVDLGIDLNKVKFGTYVLEDWMEDVKTRIKVEKNNKHLKELKEAKETLNSLLSKDKKTEMKLKEIEELLK